MALSEAQIKENIDTLKAAARVGDLKEIRRILEIEDMKPHAWKNGNESLMAAAVTGQFEAMKLLLTNDSIKDRLVVWENNILSQVCGHGYLTIVKYLLTTYPSVQQAIAADTNRSLRWAVEFNHMSTAVFLLSFPAAQEQITASDNYALQKAAKNKNVLMTQYLLSFSAVRELFLRSPKDMTGEEKAFIQTQLEVINSGFASIRKVGEITLKQQIADTIDCPMDLANVILQYAVTPDLDTQDVEKTFREQFVSHIASEKAEPKETDVLAQKISQVHISEPSKPGPEPKTETDPLPELPRLPTASSQPSTVSSLAGSLFDYFKSTVENYITPASTEISSCLSDKEKAGLEECLRKNKR